MEDFNYVLEKNPRDAQSLLGRAVILLKREDISGAARDFKAFLRVRPDDPLAPKVRQIVASLKRAAEPPPAEEGGALPQNPDQPPVAARHHPLPDHPALSQAELQRLADSLLGHSMAESYDRKVLRGENAQAVGDIHSVPGIPDEKKASDSDVQIVEPPCKGLCFAALFLAALARADNPRGFFVEDLRHSPPVPAFYNIETHQLQPFAFRQHYTSFIDVTWDRNAGCVFFSARLTPKDPYRVYLKNWPDGEEKVIYENPLGPFRFLLSPDGSQLALQVQGPSAWPILAVHDWQNSKTTLLGQGFSPDWSPDGKRLLFLQIPGSLPSWLVEYRVDTATTTMLISEPVAEAVYADSSDLIVLKTAKQSKVQVR